MGSIMCLICNQILETKDTNDYKQCNCINEAYIKGGRSICSYGAKNKDLLLVYDRDGERWNKADNLSDEEKKKWWEELEETISKEEKTKGLLKKGEKYFLS